MKSHQYKTDLKWTGNRGNGTAGYRSYDRSYSVMINGKPTLEGSADPAFRGDVSKWNPEELFLASLTACHMLWYLHLCADEEIHVMSYKDQASGVMEEMDNGSGKFAEVVLHPQVTITHTVNLDKAEKLHQRANEMCFIANSCNFPVRHEVKMKLI
ncbi:OsmC family protein [Rhodohalobacter sp. 8-1]|uniref:OsmC family protein n=1 Tax=Rhodohalobacter sp. 8-1 TaxID=3131972 RepID=UPI0030ED66E2